MKILIYLAPLFLTPDAKREILQISSKPYPILNGYCQYPSPGYQVYQCGYGHGYQYGRPAYDQGYGLRSGQGYQGGSAQPINLNIYPGSGGCENPKPTPIDTSSSTAASQLPSPPSPLPSPTSPPPPISPPPPTLPPPVLPLPPPQPARRGYDEAKRSNLFSGLFCIPGAMVDSLLNGEVAI